MFSVAKICTLLAATATFTSALKIQANTGLTSATSATIKWTNEVGDPTTWSFYLINTLFNDKFGLANNVDPAAGQLTLTLPVVPTSDGYTWQAVNLSNVSEIYATSGTFFIGSLSSSLISESPSSASSVRSSSASASVSRSSSVSVVSSTVVTTSTSVIPTVSRSITTASSTGTSAPAASSSAPAAPFNSAVGLTTGSGLVMSVIVAGLLTL